MRKYLSLIVTVVAISSVYAQESLQMYITANGNYYLPRNSGKQTYPILAYDSDADPKLLLGGFGAGFMMMKDINKQLLWRAQVNISRRAYWNESMLLTDITGVPLGEVACKGVDVVTGLAGTVHYRMGNHFSAGTGMGFDALVYSYSRLPDRFGNVTVTNGYYRPIVPLIPVELSLSFNKVLVNVRYQHALINRLKGSLAEHKDDTYSALFIELGYRIH